MGFFVSPIATNEVETQEKGPDVTGAEGEPEETAKKKKKKKKKGGGGGADPDFLHPASNPTGRCVCVCARPSVSVIWRLHIHSNCTFP